jgi:hypothetical protein
MHPTSVEGQESMKLLAKGVARLRYDSLREFLQELSITLVDDSQEDYLHERYKLAEELFNLATVLAMAVNHAQNIENICKPYNNPT